MILSFIFNDATLYSGCYSLKKGTTMLGYLNWAIPLEDEKVYKNKDLSREEKLAVKAVTIASEKTLKGKGDPMAVFEKALGV